MRSRLASLIALYRRWPFVGTILGLVVGLLLWYKVVGPLLFHMNQDHEGLHQMANLLQTIVNKHPELLK